MKMKTAETPAMDSSHLGPKYRFWDQVIFDRSPDTAHQDQNRASGISIFTINIHTL